MTQQRGSQIGDPVRAAGGAASVDDALTLRPPLRAKPSPTRERLLTAARETIERGGYSGASVAAIAARAEVATGTLYRHFPSKAELFVDVFRVVCSHEMAAAEAAAESAVDDGPMAQVDAIITAFAERALANPTLAWSLIAEPVDPAVERVRLQFRAAYRTTVAAYLRAAIDAGEAPEQNAELTATALVGAANEVLAGPLAHPRTSADAALITGALRALWRRAAGA